jgi:hypothetical protein
VQPSAVALVAPSTVAEVEEERLEEYLEASQAAFEATEQEVQSVHDQLVYADGRVAGKFLLAILVHPFLLVLLLILLRVG